MEQQPSVVSSEAIPFSEWQSAQDFDYTNVRGEVVDYVNDFVNYNNIDTIIDQQEDVSWEESLSQASGLDTDSEEFEMARSHINTYITTTQNNVD